MRGLSVLVIELLGITGVDLDLRWMDGCMKVRGVVEMVDFGSAVEHEAGQVRANPIRHVVGPSVAFRIRPGSPLLNEYMRWGAGQAQPLTRCIR